MLREIKKLYALWQLLENPVCGHKYAPSLKKILKLAFESVYIKKYSEQSNYTITEFSHTMACSICLETSKAAEGFFRTMPSALLKEIQKIRQM